MASRVAPTSLLTPGLGSASDSSLGDRLEGLDDLARRRRASSTGGLADEPQRLVPASNTESM